MVPVLFHFGDDPIGSHDVFVLVGVIAATWMFVWRVVRERGAMEPRLWWIVGIALVTGSIAARLGNLVHVPSDAADLGPFELFLHGGKSVLGGLAGAYAGVHIGKKVVGYHASTGDWFAPAVALGIGVGRVGCFLTEGVGTPTSLPWGISVSSEVAARIPNCSAACRAGAAMHPSFVYEIVFHLVALVVMLRMLDRPHRAGDVFKWYLVAYAVFRFLVEFVRGNPTYWLGLSGSQVFLLGTLPLGVAWFLTSGSRRDQPSEQSMPATVATEEVAR